MKKFFVFLTAITISGVFFTNCGNNGDNDKSDSEELYPDCKPYTRWWWFSSEIDTNDVREQLIWLKEEEFGGVEIAWIYPMGLDSTTAHPAFLSEEWSRAVSATKRMADSLGLGCDFTYGTLWPFSDVDLPEGDQTRTYFDSIEEAARSFTWDHPLTARILNHLDKNAFVRYAAKMNKGLANAYKGRKSGLFVDSWEVETQYLWTPGFGTAFQKEHGYDIEPYMKDKSLLDKVNGEVLYDYMHTLSGYVLREFYQPFAENATKVGAFSRAQCGGAPTDLLNAFSLVDVPETEAILYEPSFSRIPASAATLAGKKVVSSETFTCAYGWTSLRHKNGRGQSPYQGKEQIADLKLICDALFANGTNQIIWHGFPFNKVGDTSNFFYTTCQISTYPGHNLTGKQLADFNKYMTNVSKYMRKGINYSDLAVYLPLEDAWTNGFYPDSLRPVKVFYWGQYEMRYIKTPEAFKGMQPLWVNEHYLKSASYSNGTLQCGSANFKALYCDVEFMDIEGLKAILKHAKNGLPVCLARTPSEPGKVKHPEYASLLTELQSLDNVSDNPSVITAKPLIEGSDLPDFWCRYEGDSYYVFVANPLTKTIKYPLQYGYAFTDKGCTREITINHHGKTEQYTLNFHPMESLLLKISKKGIEQIDLGFVPEKL